MSSIDSERPSARRPTAFVTGAAEGIGAAIACALADNGFDVAISSTSVERLADTAAHVKLAGARALAITLDLRSQSDIKSAMSEVASAYEHIDVLVNNAGVSHRKFAVDVTAADWESVIGTNLTGTFFLTQLMGRHLIDSKRLGGISNVASTHGVVGVAQRLVYGISKAGVIYMTKMLAIEWAKHGIRVNAVAPGTVETPSRAAAFAADPAMRKSSMDRIPLQRFATTQEVAGAVCSLASPQAAYITGHTLLLDGGLTAG